MVVDDLVACGAEPLFLQDYVACGKVVPERIAAIVTGIAAGCTLAGAALVGGETAEHGDLMDADEYDLAATAVGVVEADAVLGPGAGDRRRRGDRDGVVRLPLQRLLAGPPGGERRRPRPARHPGRAGPAPGRGAARAHPHLRPRLPGAGRGARRRRGCTPSPTSPAAGWPATPRGWCPTGSRRCSTAAPGRCPRRCG